MLVLKKFGSNKMLVQNIVSQIFCQDWVSDSWDIPNMDKCSQDKSWIDKCHMSPWQLAFVKDGPSQPLKFGQNRVSNSWNIAKLIPAPAPAGLRLALFPFDPLIQQSIVQSLSII